MTNTIEAAAENHPPISRDEMIAEIEAKIEGQLIIARHGSGWALIAKTNFWDDDPEDSLQVLYTGLQSRAAAEIALSGATEAYFDDLARHPLGHNIPGNEATEREWTNAVGRILEVLREADRFADLDRPDWASVAPQVYWAAKDQQPRRGEVDAWA
jgi:hypothetical protein